MKYKIDGWNNFCRVFELPEKFSSAFCFGGGIPTTFIMVDWFNPVQGLPQPTISQELWLLRYEKIDIIEKTEDELRSELIPWLSKKIYIKQNRRYLIIFDFGCVITFVKEPADDDKT